MNKVLEYFSQLNEEKIIDKNIKVIGWQFSYDYHLISSLTPYLFEKLNVIENIAPQDNQNRDLRIRDKKYITIHDTGDSLDSHTALFWSNTVYNQKLMDTLAPYAASFQYVVGDDNIYHNIPDNEIAYHAGDSTKYDYKLYDTGVENEGKIKLSINNDGYFYINDKKTLIKAPTKIIGGKEKICNTDDINDQGLLIVIKNGRYYMGEIYYNDSYGLIANRGGNNNSIGIESCINQGCNLYYIYQKTAKLVAKLLDENNLNIFDVKQHHYFSGKNCPQTIRTANLWPHLLHLIEVETNFRKFEKEGYKIKLIVNDERVDNKGLIKSLGDKTPIKYSIETSFENKIETMNFEKIIND